MSDLSEEEKQLREAIKNQQKEIEDLKNEIEYLNIIIESDNDNYINKNKISEKIKQLEKELKITEDLFSGSVNYYILKSQIDLLKELLEE